MTAEIYCHLTTYNWKTRWVVHTVGMFTSNSVPGYPDVWLLKWGATCILIMVYSNQHKDDSATCPIGYPDIKDIKVALNFP